MSTLTQQTPPKAHDTGGFAGGIAELAGGKLYVLQNPFALDGRVSAYPGSARGYSVANSYLLTQSDAALPIDTGLRQALLFPRQSRPCRKLPGERAVSMWT